MGASPVIEAVDIYKSYGPVAALAGVCLQVYAGEILGVLGPNGAGKTTFVEILEGLRIADSGTIIVLGRDPAQYDIELRRQMGVCMQKTALPQALSVVELLRLYSAIYPNALPRTELMASLGLEEKRDARVRTLSGGQLQRLSVALALIGRPHLLFLDEPTSELDPHGRRAVWDVLLERRRANNQTTILTTHQMEEAQQLCTRVAILDHGKLLDLDTPAALIGRHCPGSVICFVSSAGADLSAYNGSVELDKRDLSRVNVAIHTTCLERTMQSLMASRGSGALPMDELRVEAHTLEDVFLSMTGRRIRD